MNTVDNSELLAAALEGLELQRQRIEQQIANVRSMLDGGSGAAPARRGPKPGMKRGAGTAAKSAGGKRTLSPAARKRIAAAQKRRWAEFRKRQESGE